MLPAYLRGRARAFVSYRAPKVWRAYCAFIDRYSSLRPARRQKVFGRIFDENRWGAEESVSGSGSTTAQTEVLRKELPKIFRRYDIERLLDVPCGDFAWMREIVSSLGSYVGGDVVPRLVAQLQAAYASANVSFKVIDIVRQPLPDADAILARDVFIHFSYADIRRSILNISKSSAKWLLTTTYPEHSNRDIITGEWRPINLSQPPFDLPDPVEVLNERNTHDSGMFSDKSLAIWNMNDIRRWVTKIDMR